MKNDIIIYVPSESHSTVNLSMKEILGVPLFLRGILTLEDAGFTNITLLAPKSERRHVLKSWRRYFRRKKINLHFVWTPSNHQIDGNIFDEILEKTPDEVSIINANLLITKSALTPWNGVKITKGQHLKAVIDRGLPPITRFSKINLLKFREVLNKAPIKIEELIRLLLDSTTPHPASRAWKSPVMLVTPFTPRGEPTHFLTEQIRLSTPMWIARNINKRISLPASVILARLRVSPNTITIFNMIIGMAATVGAAGRTYTGLLIGAALFQLASIVDGCDGEVAKLTFRTSKFGQYIDSISDNLALAGFITGLMIHKYRVSDHDPVAFVWGGALLLGFFVILGFMIIFLKKNTNSASFVTFDKEYLQKLSDKNYPKYLLIFIKYGKYVMKKDCFSLLFLIFAIFGILPLCLYIATVGAWLCVAILIYLNLKHRGPSAGEKGI